MSSTLCCCCAPVSAFMRVSNASNGFVVFLLIPLTLTRQSLIIKSIYDPSDTESCGSCFCTAPCISAFFYVCGYSWVSKCIWHRGHQQQISGWIPNNLICECVAVFPTLYTFGLTDAVFGHVIIAEVNLRSLLLVFLVLVFAFFISVYIEQGIFMSFKAFSVHTRPYV